MGRSQNPFFFDIACKARASAVIASVDASNCYDRITHTIAWLVFQAFSIPKSAIESMLGGIKNMKFFLSTNFGNSKRFAGGGVSVKVQGLTQGNAPPPLWVGGHQHGDSESTRKEGAQRQVQVPNNKPISTYLGHSLCRRHGSSSHQL